MEQLRFRRDFLIMQVWLLALAMFFIFWSVGMWRQSDSELSRNKTTEEWHRNTSSEKKNGKALALFGGILLLGSATSFLIHQWTKGFALQIGNEYADAFQISSRDTIEIKPILGSNGHALLLSLRYKSNWKPRFQSFKIYRGPESVSAVSYNIELRDDKGTVLYATTLSHDTKENDGGGEVNWKEQEIVFGTEAYECTLHIRPNYDTKSLRESGLDGAALTIMLHIKLAVGVRWRDRHNAQNLRAPLSSARGVVISQT